MNKENYIPICFASDDNYTQHLTCAIASILKNAKEEYIKIYLITDGLTKENKQKLEEVLKLHPSSIEYVKPKEELLKFCPNTNNSWQSMATYYRLFIPEIIPEEKVLYLDSDIIVRSSLKELYDKEMGNNLILGVEDIDEKDDIKRLNIPQYINAGVLLMNIKKLKEEKYVEKMFKCLLEKKERIKKHDQDIINLTCYENIGKIERQWNTQVRRKGTSEFEKIENPKILHFISPKKPWTILKPLTSTKWHKEYFKYLEFTEFKDFIKEYKKKSLMILPIKMFYPTGIIKTILNEIFSIKNSSDKKTKIITILGIKIKKKRSK